MSSLNDYIIIIQGGDEMRWSLAELYPSFESEEYSLDLKKLDEQIEELAKWAAENFKSKNDPVSSIEGYLKKSIEFSTLYTKLMGYSNLSLSVEAKNKNALQSMEQLKMKRAKITKPNVQFQNFIGSLNNLDEIINTSGFLKEHRFHLNQIRDRNKYLLSEKEEVLISKMQNTGSTAWAKLQNMLSSTLMVDIELDEKLKQLPLPIVRNMAYDKDKDIRITAYNAELQAYKKVEESSAACLNGIKGEVLTTSELRGYESPLEETLFQSRMDEKTLNSMLSAIEEALPVFHKYYRKKAEILGHDNGLPFYDLFAPISQVNKTYSYKDAQEYIVDNFRTFSDKLADFANNAFINKWIDAEPREGKRGGAFCFNLHPIKESRILANFNGSFSNVITLAHELGHGYHGLCLQKASILNSRYPMPIAETASIFSETIVMNAALSEVNDEEKLGILESYISDAGQVIVDIYSRFLFEKELFERRQNYSPSVEDLKEMMIDAQKSAYGQGLDPDFLHPYMWINKSHYYSAGRNYYNFPYAFGLLFSKGLYVKYLEDKSTFVSKYDEFLAATGKNTIIDVAKIMDIDVHSIDFFRSSLELIEQDIETFIKLADDIK